MRNASAILLFGSIFVVYGCWGRGHRLERDGQLVNSDNPQAANASIVNVPQRNCDFSEFHALRMGDWLSHGGISKRVEPVYPPEALRGGLQARISVRVLIDKEGEVMQFCGTGPSPLREAGEKAAQKFRFRVPELNGKKVSFIEDTLVFDFVLQQETRPAQR